MTYISGVVSQTSRNSHFCSEAGLSYTKTNKQKKTHRKSVLLFLYKEIPSETASDAETVSMRWNKHTLHRNCVEMRGMTSALQTRHQKDDITLFKIY